MRDQHLTDYMTSLVNQMERLRVDGRTWAEIADEMGYGNAHSAKSTYCREHRRRRLLAPAPAGAGALACGGPDQISEDPAAQEADHG